MEARNAKRKKQAQRTTRRKEFIQTATAQGNTTPTEADYAARRTELLEACEVPAEMFEEVDERLRSFMDPFLETFTRREQYDHARTYVSGLLSELQEKNAEAIAYLYGQERIGLQRFLGYAEWDDAPLRMELARQIGEMLGEEDGVLVFDPSGFPKSGRQSVGVARQWCGRLGKVDNCQVAVYLGYVSGVEHALVDTRLYLPKEWTSDKARCQKAGVPPQHRRHQTRHQLCLEMLQEKGGLLPHSWVTGDDEMGRVFWFRDRLRILKERYLLAVPSNTLIRDLEVDPPEYSGRGRYPKRPWVRVDRWKAACDEERWTELDVRDGSKGPLIVEMVKRLVVARNSRGQEGHEEVLVILRYRDRDDAEVTKVDYYLSNASVETPLLEFARAAKAEHRIEECLQRAKSEAGLADYQVRNWAGWHHHQTLCLLATWFLLTETRRGKKMDPGHYATTNSRRHFPHPSGCLPVHKPHSRSKRSREVDETQGTSHLLPFEAA